jgi:hypothetical protein
MTETTLHVQPHDVDAAIRKRILERAALINERLLSRLATVAQDIDESSHKEAISCLGGLERRIYAIRSLLFLLP